MIANSTLTISILQHFQALLDGKKDTKTFYKLQIKFKLPDDESDWQLNKTFRRFRTTTRKPKKKPSYYSS